MLESLLLLGALTLPGATNDAQPSLEVHSGAESSSAVGASVRIRPLAGALELREALADGSWSPADEKTGERWTSHHRLELAYDPQLQRITLRVATAGRETLAAERTLSGRLTLDGPDLLRLEVVNFDPNASVHLEDLELVQDDSERTLRDFGHGTMSSDLATIWEPGLAAGFVLRGTLRVDGAVRPRDARVWVDFGLGAGRRVEVQVEGHGWVRSEPARISASPGAKGAVGFFGRDERIRLEAVPDPERNLAFLGWSSGESVLAGERIDLPADSTNERWTARFEAAAESVTQGERPSAGPSLGGGSFVFSNTSTITIPAGAPGTTSGPAAPYPSTITVSGPIGGAITDVNVVLDGVTHTFPDDLDIVVSSPIGDVVLIMSDCCGSDDVSGFFWRFDDEAPAPMSDSTIAGCLPFDVQPTNYGTGDTFPAPAPAGPYAGSLSVFDAENPNGTWRLYVVDDTAADVGSISDGWAIEITTEPYEILIPGAGTSGVGNPYPSSRSVAGSSTLFGTVVDVDATLVDVTHSFPDDLDVLLVGPSSAASILMSDACGGTDILNYIWTFSDENPAPLSDNDLSGCNPIQVQPTNYGTGDTWPAPAPAGVFNANLSIFDGGSALGVWRLFVVDDATADVGFLETDWYLDLVTTGIFRDGFESGNTGQWSLVLP